MWSVASCVQNLGEVRWGGTRWEKELKDESLALSQLRNQKIHRQSETNGCTHTQLCKVSNLRVQSTYKVNSLTGLVMDGDGDGWTGGTMIRHWWCDYKTDFCFLLSVIIIRKGVRHSLEMLDLMSVTCFKNSIKTNFGKDLSAPDQFKSIGSVGVRWLRTFKVEWPLLRNTQNIFFFSYLMFVFIKISNILFLLLFLNIGLLFVSCQYFSIIKFVRWICHLRSVKLIRNWENYWVSCIFWQLTG